MMIDKELKPDATGKKQDTRFKPGQSGNPASDPETLRELVFTNLAHPSGGLDQL
jgi:hypothetical protein